MKKSGPWIILSIFIGTMFAPKSSYSLKTNTILMLLMFIFIAITILLTNKKIIKESIFESKVTKSKKISVLFILVAVYFFVSMVFSDNVQGVLDTLQLPRNQILIVFFSAISAGFFEEYLTRGYLLNLMQRIFIKKLSAESSLILSIILSSVLFGCLHFINYAAGASIGAVFQQVFYATAFGFFFALVRIYSNTIIAGAIVHTLIDFQPEINAPVTVEPWTHILLWSFPLFVLSFILILVIVKNQQSNILIK